MDPEKIIGRLFLENIALSTRLQEAMAEIARLRATMDTVRAFEQVLSDEHMSPNIGDEKT